MSNRSRFALVIASGISAVDLALISFIATGLLSERFPLKVQNQMKGAFDGVPCVVLAVSFILVYFWARQYGDKQTHAVKWLLLGILSSALAFVVGGIAFSLSYRWFPRDWFSRGGDWDIDPLLETIGSGIVLALGAFWLVYSRSWRRASP